MGGHMDQERVRWTTYEVNTFCIVWTTYEVHTFCIVWNTYEVNTFCIVWNTYEVNTFWNLVRSRLCPIIFSVFPPVIPVRTFFLQEYKN